MVQNSPGRPLMFDPDVALSRAVLLFWERGFDGASLPELEAATGLGRSSIYNTFGGKPELFRAALDRYAGDMDAAFLEPLRTGAAGIDDVLAFLDRLDAHTDDGLPAGCLICNTLVELGEVDAVAGGRVGDYLRRLELALRAALGRAVDLGEIRGGTEDDRAALLTTLVVGASSVARGDDPRRLVAAARRQVEEWRR
ncbi:MAG: TetR/AcrR family transcriptional regulator [Thermoleophilia bacterium]